MAVKNTFIHFRETAEKPPELRRVSSAPGNLHESPLPDSRNHKMLKVRKTVCKDSKRSQNNFSRGEANFGDANCQPMECEANYRNADRQSQWTELPSGCSRGMFAVPFANSSTVTMQQIEAQSNATNPIWNAMPQNDSKPCDVGHLGLHGRVWQHASHADGCRLVQQALDDAPSDAVRSTLAKELHTHVSEAWRSPNANHVLQKCISTMPQHDFQFIIDEMVQAGPGAILAAARHQFGCRILQRLLEFSSPAQISKLVEYLLEEAVSLCKDMYGSFVLQHLLQHGAEMHVLQVTRLLAANISTIGSDPYGVTVLERALSSHAPWQDRILLANALAAEPNMLLSMSIGHHGRHGHNVAKLALKMSAPEHQEFALLSLQQRRKIMNNSRYGKKLMKCVDDMLRQR
jgi:hypothetical protein